MGVGGWRGAGGGREGRARVSDFFFTKNPYLKKTFFGGWGGVVLDGVGWGG